MKFVLTYDGPLKSNDKKNKWDIRKHIHPQLDDLWKVHPALIATTQLRHMSAHEPHVFSEVHHSSTNASPASSPLDASHRIGGIGGSGNSGGTVPSTSPADVDLLEPITVGGREFKPLVTNNLGLRCALRVQFLRAEAPGGLFQEGDMDNRLKTIFDALCVPPHENQIVKDGETTPLYCLLGDDSLITTLSVDTQRYLSPPATNKERHVRLLIEVDVRPYIPRRYSQAFLGD